MKKNIFLFALFLTAILSNAQQHVPQSYNEYVPFHQYLQQRPADMQQHNYGNNRTNTTSVYGEIGYLHILVSNNGTSFTYSDSGTYSYSANAYLTGGNKVVFQGNNWVSYSQFTDNLVGSYGPSASETGQVWVPSTSSYRNSYMYTYTYVNTTYIASKLYQVWDTTASSFTNVNQYAYTYDGNNNLTSALKQVWSSGAWVNDTGYIYGYNSHNLNTTSVTLRGNGAGWDSVLKQTYSYDANLNNFQVFSSAWTGSAWVNYNLINKSFNAATNQLTGSLTQLWSNAAGTYINSYQDRYIYDFNNNNTQYNNYAWDTINQVWVPLLQNIYNYFNYFGGADKIYEVDASYNSGTGTFQSTDSYYYTYQLFTWASGINKLQNELSASLYPNPVAGSHLNVNLTMAFASTLSIEIYDGLGRIMQAGTCPVVGGDNKLNVSLIAMAPGSYYLQIKDKSSNKTSLLEFVKSN